MYCVSFAMQPSIAHVLNSEVIGQKTEQITIEYRAMLWHSHSCDHTPRQNTTDTFQFQTNK